MEFKEIEEEEQVVLSVLEGEVELKEKRRRKRRKNRSF